MKVIMTGGGTGGHVNPALAIASIIEKNIPDVEISYVGTPNGIENKLVPSKYPMYHVNIQGLRRSLSLSNIKTAYLTMTSFGKAKKLLRRLSPDLVVGTGGYVSWPVVRAAAALGIPCALHECNAVPGLAVRMLEKKADVIFTNFRESSEALPKAKKVVWTGTPVRAEIHSLNKDEAKKSLEYDKYDKVILSFGGSLGADTLNREALSLMEKVAAKNENILYVHAAGARNYPKLLEDFNARGLDKYENIKLYEYIFDMPLQLAAADIVICRSGAMTLCELAAAGKASILIPSPNVTDDQQTKNAALFEKAGAAVMIKESDLADGKLASVLEELVENKEKLASMEKTARTFDMPDCEKIIFTELEAIMKK